MLSLTPKSEPIGQTATTHLVALTSADLPMSAFHPWLTSPTSDHRRPVRSDADIANRPILDAADAHYPELRVEVGLSRGRVKLPSCGPPSAGTEF